MGVAILGFAFFSKSLSALIVESGSYWGGNNALLESLIQSQADGVAGTFLLLVGFVLQFLGSLGIQCEIAAQLSWSVLAILLVAYVTIVRRRLVAGRLRRALQLHHEQVKQGQA